MATARSALPVLALLGLLSWVPPAGSGPNAYIKRFYNTCWRFSGVCRVACQAKEVYHILCDSARKCCVKKAHLPPVVGV
ncbi:Beta-defensin 30 [Galemys pyrenaicus]|uniref:Beta-defensin n=1 Tax=Galemys pyrenaicus TaxID=202257 RepID=A0A8J6DFK4_GALPY|nr:Beta-defensin 30 [Galemys pyrenaicus]